MIHTREKEREGQTVKCQQENLKQMQDQHKTLRAQKKKLAEFSRHAVNFKFSMWFLKTSRLSCSEDLCRCTRSLGT